MKVLFAVWELDPFIKVGGLGDVAASLPRALNNLGVDIRTVIPFYKALRLGRSRKKLIKRFTLLYDGKMEKVELFYVTHPVSKTPVYLIKNSKYLDTPLFPDTFAFFDKAIVAITAGNYAAWVPEIIHCNDSHAALIPLLLKESNSPIKTMLTIHNLMYQARTSLSILTKLGIEHIKGQLVAWEIAAKQINFLLEGIIHADVITTVSPTYAKEILTEEYGAGLEEFLRARKDRLFGVLNGIDDHRTEKMHLLHLNHDAPLSVPYSCTEEKKLNKLRLQKKLGLTVDESLPLLIFIGRFDPKQKGIDLLHKMLREIDITGYQFIILGKGDTEWEERFTWIATFYPKNIACEFIFNDTLAHQMYAASDFIIIPSRFEPCGLIQMLAMSYGTLPIAHKTGGLIDSIQDGYNGFLFAGNSAWELKETMEKAVTMWRKDKKKYKQMVKNALATDFSWDKSAKEYLRLYEQMHENAPITG